ncbi:MAG: carbon monoxide dehydrogenase subunit [Actinomycetia bacterium]|nr:carbon monoxide dehydrogenase subunit [Actinomycetes bacterium]
MDLTNEFSVSVPVDEAWAVLTDLERIAPCMPGAELQEVEGDEFRGIVKVKVGPITAQYKGAASFLERDDAGHKAVIKAEGRDTRGQGNASATITATLVAEGDGTKVSVVTDLTVTGKVAQFGRGVMADVSAKLMDQFVKALEADVLSGSPSPSPVETPATETGAPSPGAAPSSNGSGASSGPRKIDSKPAEPVDLLGTAGSPVVKRVGPIVGVLVVLLWLLRRRKKKK